MGASRQALSPAGASARGGDNPGSSFLGQMVVVDRGGARGRW